MIFRIPQPLQPLNPARPLIQGLAWYALISRPAREIKAAHWLEALDGVMTLVPLETRHRSKGSRGGHFKKVTAQYRAPLLPRVVFAGFPAPPTWPAIWASPHILGAVGLRGTPARIPISQIERFRSTAEEDRLKAGLPVLKVGSRARFVGDGVFRGHLVEIASLGPNSATVLQEFFGSVREVRISRDDLEAA